VVTSRILSGDYHPEVLNITEWCSSKRADVLRPLPPGLIRRPADHEVADADGFKPSFLELTNFIGFIETP
jgi:hypothetical protein